MAFQIKDFASIVAAQINHARSATTKITDFQPGSVVRTIMEAPAVEMEELYLQMFLGLRDAIPVATFLSFGFDRLPAASANGFVSISASTVPSEAIEIPVGTSFSTADERLYESTEAVTWTAGAQSVRVPVAAVLPGLAGNVAAGVIVSSPAFGAGFTVSNSAITTGRDIETDPEREARFAEFVAALSRGTVSACLYAAQQSQLLDADGNISEYVTRVGLEENPGIVRIYVYSSSGVPSQDLISNGQTRIDGSRDEVTGTVTPGYRSAGVRVDVLPMSERAISLAVQVQMLVGFDLTAAVIQSITDLYAGAIEAVQPGTTLYLGGLVETMLQVPGVKSIIPASNQNIVCATNEALTPGTLTVTAL